MYYYEEEQQYSIHCSLYGRIRVYKSVSDGNTIVAFYATRHNWLSDVYWSKGERVTRVNKTTNYLR